MGLSHPDYITYKNRWHIVNIILLFTFSHFWWGFPSKPFGQKQTGLCNRPLHSAPVPQTKKKKEKTKPGVNPIK